MQEDVVLCRSQRARGKSDKRRWGPDLEAQADAKPLLVLQGKPGKCLEVFSCLCNPDVILTRRAHMLRGKPVNRKKGCTGSDW